MLTAETSSKIRTLERTSKALKSEKAILQEEIGSLRDQVAEKDKDLRGVKGELREIQEESSRLAEKLTDIRAQKTKFSRLAREKAEEMGERGRERRGGRERGREREREEGGKERENDLSSPSSSNSGHAAIVILYRGDAGQGGLAEEEQQGS